MQKLTYKYREPWPAGICRWLWEYGDHLDSLTQVMDGDYDSDRY